MTAILDAALQYASWRWRVTPVHTMCAGRCTCGRSTCPTPAKHPRLRDWTTQSTMDAEIIERWFSTWWPESNLGVATGEGLVVLDVDPGRGGDASLAELEHQHGLPDTPRQLSGGGGVHLFFATDIPIGNKVNLLPGVDIRGDGGLIVVAPSLHRSGRHYAWDVTADPSETPLAPLPRWLLSLTGPRGDRQRDTGGELSLVDGQRNDRLFRLACQWRRSGIGQDALADMLRAVNHHHVHPPLAAAELAAIAASAARYAPGDDDTFDVVLVQALDESA